MILFAADKEFVFAVFQFFIFQQKPHIYYLPFIQHSELIINQKFVFTENRSNWFCEHF